MKEIRIGLIGFGMIGKMHTLAYRNLPLSVKDPQVLPCLAALLRSQLSKDADLVAANGFKTVTLDPDYFYAQQLDAVDICTPNHLHFAEVQRALASGAAVYCEKPLGLNYRESVELANLAESNKAITQVAYTMRYSPTVRLAKRMLAEGHLGSILHFRAFKFHSSYLDAKRPLTWRLRFDQSGGGAFQDLGSHLANLACYFFGAPLRVRAEMRTFIAQRPEKPGSAVLKPVDVDDWAQCSLELPGGGVGSLEVSRMAAGYGELTGFDIQGSSGALHYRSDHPDEISVYDMRQKQWRSIEEMPAPTEGERPIALLAPEKKFSQGDMLNRHMTAIHDFLLNVSEGKPGTVDFRDAAQTQAVVEAAYRSAQQGGEWLALNDLLRA